MSTTTIHVRIVRWCAIDGGGAMLADAVHACERVGIHYQSQVTINLPIVRIQLPQRQRHFNSRQQRTKRAAIRDDDINPTTLFILEYRSIRREPDRHESNTRNRSLV